MVNGDSRERNTGLKDIAVSDIESSSASSWHNIISVSAASVDKHICIAHQLGDKYTDIPSHGRMLTSRFLYLLAGREALVNEDGFIRMLFSFYNSDVESHFQLHRWLRLIKIILLLIRHENERNACSMTTTSTVSQLKLTWETTLKILHLKNYTSHPTTSTTKAHIS